MVVVAGWSSLANFVGLVSLLSEMVVVVIAERWKSARRCESAGRCEREEAEEEGAQVKVKGVGLCAQKNMTASRAA